MTFKHKPLLVALFTSTILLQGCSTLPDMVTEETENEDSLMVSAQAGYYAQRAPRSIASPVWELDNNQNSEDAADREQTVWNRVAQGMGFAHLHHNDEIAAQIEWFRDNPNYLLEVTDRSAPFIYEIVSEIERRNLPLELALIPVVESSYNPAARSSSNAAGLWQFMARTAQNFGLKRDWWYDGRHDPIASTSAALDYLERLHAQFNGDWLLALAAYNAGEGNVQRAIDRNQRRNRATDFWSLSLPGETRRHIPRILGLAHVMADPDRYGISLSQIPNQPYLAQIDVGSQIDLTLVANLAEIDPDMVTRLNPGYLQWATHPDGPHTVWLPADRADVFRVNFDKMERSPITWDRYVIRSGDTLSRIASAHNTQVSVLQQVNNISGSRIVAGQTLLIPRAYRDGDPLPLPTMQLAAANTQPVPGTSYTVRSGDSLWGIATRYQLDLNDLMAWNNIDTTTVIRPGQSLKLQPDVTLAANDSSTVSEASQVETTQYRVRRGDTLAKIAREHQVTVRELTDWNGINANSIIRPGQELIIHRP